MKKILLLIVLALTTQTIKAQAVVLDSNGVTIKWTGTTAPSPRFVQASPRGTMEWFAIVDNSTKGSVTNYAKNVPSTIISFTPPGGLSPIPFNNIVTTLMTNMEDIFRSTSDFNQPIESWDVSNVTNMTNMFWNATSFNQPIGSWDVSNVNSMNNMFGGATAFNQPIGSWNVSKVTDMNSMFWNAPAFNQPLGSWDLSNVTGMAFMFSRATSFNQPIGSWNVSNVTFMIGVFYEATAFNQPIGSWNVSKVNTMEAMFRDSGLSTANYDALLIGWSTIISPETPLKSNIQFSGGYSTYCNGQSARNILINTYGWSITDSGPDFNCTTLETEEFDTIGLKLYPNPVLSFLNIDNNLTNQPYNIVDTLGKIVLKGKLNEGNNSINVEQLSKGIYYLKVSDNSASKFIKE